MTNTGPINMESVAGEPASDISGREVNPDKDESTQPPAPSTEQEVDAHMKEVLEHVPEPLKERVSKISREELAMPGAPKDAEAYKAFLFGEKMVRDIRRRETKKKFSWEGLPRQSG